MATPVVQINNHQHLMIARKWVSVQDAGLNRKSSLQSKQTLHPRGNIGEIRVFSKCCRNDLHAASALGATDAQQNDECRRQREYAESHKRAHDA